MGDSDDDVPLDEGRTAAEFEAGCVGRAEAGNEVGGTDRDRESNRSYGRLRADAHIDVSRPLAPIACVCVCIVAVANRVRNGSIQIMRSRARAAERERRSVGWSRCRK